jgi:hypothetical protein
VGLVENGWGIVVAVRIFIPYSPHLAHYLGLCCIRPQRNLVVSTELWRLKHLLTLIDGLIRKVLTRQQQHLFVETADHWNLRLLLLIGLFLILGRSSCRGWILLFSRGFMGLDHLWRWVFV